MLSLLKLSMYRKSKTLKPLNVGLMPGETSNKNGLKIETKKYFII